MKRLQDESVSVHSSTAVAFLHGRIEGLLAEQGRKPEQRMLVAFAGVPGSGKSTMTAALLNSLRKSRESRVAVVNMDGFHHTKEALSRTEFPLTAFGRRGAPFTFDANGFVAFVEKIKATPVTSQNDPMFGLRAPSFDHAIQDPVADDICIPSWCKIVIVEGNYVLLNQAPWSRVAALADDTWFVDLEPAVVRERLIARHLQAGIEVSHEASKLRVEENDLVNGSLVRQNLIPPKIFITG